MWVTSDVLVTCVCSRRRSPTPSNSRSPAPSTNGPRTAKAPRCGAPRPDSITT